MSECGIVIFRSAHLAVKAEKAVVKSGIECKLIPAPRHLSHDCGVALQFRKADRNRVESALVSRRVEYECIAESD